MLTVFQKNIYNSHLYAFRSSKNEPFKPKSNFDDLTEDKINQIQLLEAFLKKYKHLNIKLYFKAPYKIYSDVNYFNLTYYTKPNALKTYYLYMNQLEHQSIDNQEQIDFMLDSLIFIKKFCIDKKINLKDYLNYKEKVAYSWCEHLLSNNISIYVFLGFSYIGVNIYLLLNNIPEDEKDMFFENYNNNLSELMNNLHNSKKAKFLLMKGFQKIDKLIQQKLDIMESV